MNELKKQVIRADIFRMEMLRKLREKRGETNYALGLIIGVVVGSIVLAIVVALLNNKIKPGMESKVDDMFNYRG